MSNSSAKEQIGVTPPKAAAGAKLLTPKEAAQFWRVSESFLAKARMAGDGPPFNKDRSIGPLQRSGFVSVDEVAAASLDQ